MEESDVSDTVLRLIDYGRISWPRGASDRKKFIAKSFGKVWDALLDINIDANIKAFSNSESIHWST